MADADTNTTLRLGGAFTIERAAELKALLLAEFGQTPPEAVALDGISEMDCAGLQLLLALRRQFPALRLTEPSPAVEQLLARLHLTSLLAH